LDITKGSRLPTACSDGIYSEHCFEHIPFNELPFVLKDLRRILREGSWLRIAMPDLELYARCYLRSIETGTNLMPYSEANIGRFNTPAVFFNLVMSANGHLFVYDFNTLKMLLEEAGFRDIRKVAFMEGNDPRLLKDQKCREVESFYVEASK
jgi:predicted SAM-dependent methyltransferase